MFMFVFPFLRGSNRGLVTKILSDDFLEEKLPESFYGFFFQVQKVLALIYFSIQKDHYVFFPPLA